MSNQSQPQHAHRLNFIDEKLQPKNQLFMALHAYRHSSTSKDVWY